MGRTHQCMQSNSTSKDICVGTMILSVHIQDLIVNLAKLTVQ